MTAIFETATFADGRLMLRVRFRRNSSNVRFDGEEATWVPSFYEANLLIEMLRILDEYNLTKKARLDYDSNRNKATNYQFSQ